MVSVEVWVRFSNNIMCSFGSILKGCWVDVGRNMSGGKLSSILTTLHTHTCISQKGLSGWFWLILNQVLSVLLPPQGAFFCQLQLCFPDCGWRRTVEQPTYKTTACVAEDHGDCTAPWAFRIHKVGTGVLCYTFLLAFHLLFLEKDEGDPLQEAYSRREVIPARKALTATIISTMANGMTGWKWRLYRLPHSCR